MTKHRLFIYIVAGLFLIFAVLTLPFQVEPVQGGRSAQTWASRTATPQGGPATSTSQPSPTTDPGGGPSPNTATPQPDPNGTPVEGQPTPTSTATFVLMTPEGGYNATAQPCGVPPTVQARGTVNVRLGPGLDYEPIDSLVFLEVRPIIGRAEFGTWWLIQLPDNTTGWVADQAVAVQGYTGQIPIVDPPELDGATPTPGPLWEPTPNPVCTPLPTATATVAIAEAQPTTIAVSNNTPTEAPPQPTPTEEPVQPAPSNTPTSQPEPSATTAPTVDAGSSTTQEPPPDDGDDTAASPSSWILFIGIGLVVVGAVSWILRNR